MRAGGGDGSAEDSDTGAMDIEAFLRSVERRGFLMARLALGNDDDALDAMQDTMMRLVQRYADKPAADWRIGAEHEKFGWLTDTRQPLPYAGDRGAGSAGADRGPRGAGSREDRRQQRDRRGPDGRGGRVAAAPAAGIHAALLGGVVDGRNCKRDGLH